MTDRLAAWEVPKEALELCAGFDVAAPRFVQPHGALLVLDDTRRITGCGANSAEYLGRTPDELLGTASDQVFSCPPLDRITGSAEFRHRDLEGRVHRTGGVRIVEFIRPGFDPACESELFFDAMTRSLPDTIADLRHVVRELAPVLGYDHTMLYRFDDDWHGQVIAEVVQPGMTPFLEYWFPASDIPPQARQLYETHAVHALGDAKHADIPLILEHPDLRVDLSGARLRAFHECCKGFYCNMGVSASLSASIIVDGRLWGMLSCHHREPRWPSARLGRFFRIAARMIADRIENRTLREQTTEARHAQEKLQKIPAFVGRGPHWATGLLDTEHGLRSLVAADDCTLVTPSEAYCEGEMPAKEEWHRLADWLESNSQRGLFVTDCLSKAAPEFAHLSPQICGVMALRVPQSERSWLIWTRREKIRRLTWGGDPKTGISHVDGTLVFHPRKDFEGIPEEVRGYGEPWTLGERAIAAETIRFSLLDVIVTWQRQQTDELRERYAFLFSQVRDAVVMTDAEGIVTFYNRAAERMFGYRASERLGRPIWETYSGSRREEVIRLHHSIRSGEEFVGEWMDYRKDGTPIWVDARTQPIRDTFGKIVGLFGISRDITDRKQAYERVLKMQTLLNQAEMMARIGSWESEVDGENSFWSPESYRIFGLIPGSPVRWENFIVNVVHPEDCERFLAVWNKIRETKAEQSIEYRIIRRDKKVRWVFWHGRFVAGEGTQPDRIMGTTQDITAQRDAAARLQDSEARYRLIAENAGDLITRQSSDGIILYASPACRALLGYEPEEMVQRSKFDFVHPDDRDLRNARHQETFGEARTVTIILRLLRKDGSPVWVETTSRRAGPKYDESADIITCTRDISERVRLESQVRQAAKLEAVGRLAGGVAHDFNNLLSIVIGYGSLVSTSLSPGDPLRHAAEQIVEAGHRGAALTRQLLSLSRQQSVRRQELHINSEIGKLREFLGRLIGEDITIQTTLAPDLPPTLLNPDQFAQILMNLAVNARDAMADGGTLSVMTSAVDVDRRTVGAEPDVQPGKFIRLAIADTGVGMDDETRARIFEPFFSTKQEHGTGLGLATVYSIVRQAGGFIRVESELNSGTRFELYLPVGKSTVGDAEPKSQPRSEPPKVTPGQTIVIVEDNTAVRELTGRILRGQGYRVLEAVDAESARQAFSETGPRVDLLLTDVIMPGMHGTDLARGFQASHPDLRVVFMSGYTGAGNTRGEIGDQPFLQKPFLPEELLDIVRRTLGRS
ncbi:MAG: PAS domain S-box protein [Gemmataceae bacterium]|nr:PAS domain S-box protein [Gemmataceae bacterium]